jgi:cystathionine gamma-synthase
MKGTSTIAVHGGERRQKGEDSITNPIFQTSTYTFTNVQEIVEYTSGLKERYEYGRYGNPTVKVAEKKLAELERAEDAALFVSGMNCITSVLLAMLSQGDHVVLMDECYRKTRHFCEKILPRYGIEVTLVKTTDLDTIQNSLKKHTKLIISESPTNPYLNLVDFDQLVKISKAHKVKIIIDSTLATPYNQLPLEQGIDIVIHSTTKYLGGHNDLMGGVVLGKADFISAIKEFRGVLGGIMDPHSAYLLIRGLKSFALRMERQNNNGIELARFLATHPKVRKVYYPGLETHPQYTLAQKQMRGYGGVVSFEIEGDGDKAARFINHLKIPYIGPSFGGTETLIEQPAIVSYYELSQQERLQIGIKDELIRLALGIEDAADIIEDIRQALDQI